MNPQDSLNAGCSIMVNNIGEERLLLSHLKPHMRVLEFGHGLSTNVMAKLVRQVVSIEYNPEWYDAFKPFLDKNVTTILKPANKAPTPAYEDGTLEDYKDYVMSPMQQASAEKFDVVVIDGRARVACAEYAAKFYLKDDGLIFIHDYRHPKPPPYRRPEYEVVESFLDMKKHVFAMALFVKKGQSSPYLDIVEMKADIVELPSVSGTTTPIQVPVTVVEQPAEKHQLTLTDDKSTCWNQSDVVYEMNRFFDQHIKDHKITEHLKPFTDLLNLIDPAEYPLLLDLGCGSGILVPFCKDFVYNGADLPHIVAGCALRNYPNNFYRACDIVESDITWIQYYDVVVINGVIDIMQAPLYVLDKILKSTKKYLILHRQEISEQKETSIRKGPGYGAFAWHSTINRNDFEKIIANNGFEVVAETSPNFADWENGGASFLLQKKES